MNTPTIQEDGNNYVTVPNCNNQEKRSLRGYSAQEKCIKDRSAFCDDGEWESYEYLNEADCIQRFPCGPFPDCECDTNLTTYTKYIFPRCKPMSWEQRNNDCWLDSALYAIFANDTLAPIFSNVLDRMNDDEDENVKSIALNIINYLQGINNNKWSDMCKSKYKKAIYESMTKYNSVKHLVPDDIWPYLFNVSQMGHIGEGMAYPLLQILSLFGDTNEIDFKNIESSNFNLKCKSNKKLIRTSLEDKIKHSNSKVLIVSLDGINISMCGDDTRRAEVKEIKSGSSTWKLQSVVRGKGIHYTADTFCDKKWNYYNNMSNPTVSGIDPIEIQNVPTFAELENIIFIYTKSDSVGGRRRRKSKRSYRSRKIQYKKSHRGGRKSRRKILKTSRSKKRL